MQKVIQNLEGQLVQQMRQKARTKFMGFLLTVPHSAKLVLKDSLVYKGVSGSQSSYYIHQGEALVFVKDQVTSAHRQVDRIGNQEFCLIPFEQQNPKLSVVILRNTTVLEFRKDSIAKLSYENLQLFRACLEAQMRDYFINRQTAPQALPHHVSLLSGAVTKLSNQKSADPFSKKSNEREASGLVKMRMILNRGKSREDVELQLSKSTKVGQLTR